MEENITTLLDMDEAENISGDDYLYLVQGCGSKRDRKLKLSALFSSDPSHTLVVDSEDDIPGEFLLGKFDQFSHDVHYDTDGKVRFYADTTRAGRIIRGEPKNLDGSEFNTERVQFMAAVIDFGDESSADFVHNFHGTANFFFANVDQKLVVKNGGIVAGGGLSVPKPNAEGETLADINGMTGDIQTVGKVKGATAEFGSAYVKGEMEAESFFTNGEVSAGTVLSDVLKAKSSVSDIYRLPKKEGTTSAGVVPAEIDANCYHETSSDYTLSGDVGDIVFVDNTGTDQIKVYTGSKYDGETGEWKRKYCLLNAGCCGQFICTGLSSGKDGSRNYSWAPMFNAVVQVEN
ncbi:hypothetical protein [Fibrobacter intestinalis]|uniref:Uncharacterized protein n=1 Tax=Fibrobacter intestinalis TaxID=28122 RepID=A0A1T4S6L7_9BACT|nr:MULTISPECIES: hypothetical protein [Fibrobacter]PBC73042.1 hypothetical protein BGW94_0631 [Fibrobacter sp. NR9]SKA23889.1 hypothetical protein SAMN02745108_02987 [Fibrobacter intestinalis]